MNLADKPCYPVSAKDGGCALLEETQFENLQYGLTFRERLIIALASGINLYDAMAVDETFENVAKRIENQANAIIKQLEVKQ